ncbi:hypothetical protein F5Y19DRAFT_366575 [Xylariaceae sp. FL1651]|nr:hypothetical protein F5Y19DRAFT_366575 [Xylariaceae sp. FL1651]
MASTGLQRLTPAIRSRIWWYLLEIHKENIKDNKIIRLKFPTDDGTGEMAMYKPNLVPITLGICKESREYTLENLPNHIAIGRGIISEDTDILFFDSETLDQIELYHTWPLEQVACVKTVAIPWQAVSSNERTEDTIRIIYSQLCNIETIVLTVPRESFCAEVGCASHRSQPLTLKAMPSTTILEFDGDPARLVSLGSSITQLICDGSFWRDCILCYAQAQILPTYTDRPRPSPVIRLMEISRDCEHQRGLCLPPQDQVTTDKITQLIEDLYSSFVRHEAFREESEDSLQSLLD